MSWSDVDSKDPIFIDFVFMSLKISDGSVRQEKLRSITFATAVGHILRSSVASTYLIASCRRVRVKLIL